MTKKKNRLSLIQFILLGAILGGLVGTFLPEFSIHLKFIGEMFLNALKMMVLPLIITSLIVGVTGVGEPSKLGALGLKTFIYYFVTTCIAVAIGIVIVVTLQPGVGFKLFGAGGDAISAEPVTMIQLITRLVTPNLVKAASEFNILPLIIAAILFGVALIRLGKPGEKVIDLIRIVNEAIMQIVHWIILFTPLGVFGLIASQLGLAGGGSAVWGLLTQLGHFSVTVLIGLGTHGFVVLPIILFIFAKRNPLTYCLQVAKALVTSFGTSSSSATLPVTMQCVKEEAKVDEETADVVLPIGATVNMDGTALYEAVAAVFIAQAYGINLSLGDLVIVFFTANLASIGAAGIPQAGLVTMVLVLQAVNLPVEGIGLILAVDWILDRFRTVVNVWGDSIGAAVISQFHGAGRKRS